MKRTLLTLMCLFAMAAASTSLKAQEVTVTLIPGWTWISCPTTDSVDFATALGNFAPMQGDIIKSQWGAATYLGNRWRGAISQFYAGYGYHYYSNRDVSVMLTMGELLPQVEVTTAEPTNITINRAVVGSTVTIGEGNHIFARGVCWGTEPNPDIDGNQMVGDAIAGSQSSTLYGLTPSTSYYVRAYVVTDYGLVYGNQQSFITGSAGSGGEHEYVDLGLPSGLLWATCNVGADAPEDYGNYFAWGETQPKDYYDWNTYQYCNGGFYDEYGNFLPYFTKYCNNPDYGYNGFTDTLTTLLPEDDAATANWGDGWRMATKEEWSELIDNTTCTYTTWNDVDGWSFTASNGNCVFLPAAGYRRQSDHLVGHGYYLSSSLRTDSRYAWFFNVENWNLDGGILRRVGLSVRPVRSAPQNSVTITVLSNPTEGGIVSGGGTYEQGQSCTVTATANSGYTFVNWTENGEVVSSENPYVFTVTNDRVLEAVFTTNTQTTFTRVTSASGLEAGANYLIVGHNDELGVLAMGYQKNNNRNAVAVDEVGDVISVTIGTDPNSETDVFQFTLGGSDNAWTFFDEVKGGYLYAGSSTSNQLKTQTTLDANGQWSITFNADGTAEVVAQGENTRNNMRFNPNSDTPLFSCYAENSSIDTRVSLYKAGNVVPVQSYYITTTANPEEGGTINGGGSYAIGSTCTLTATANEGYAFINWTENGEVVSTNNPYTFTVTGNKSLVANFGGVSTLLFEDFNEDLGVFTANDVIGEQSWHQASYQGVTYASMNGYASGTANLNEDWLISPALDRTGFSDVFVEFRTAMNYEGDPLRVMVSTNYNGQRNPNNFDWQDITDAFNFSTGNYEWVESGRVGVDIAANVFYLAFVYTSNAQAARSWEIDYVRIFAANFTVNGGDDHAYVDLGLPSGLLWATCNVGAEAPEEYGDYFAWGETQPKDYYDWSNYQYFNNEGDGGFTKYCNNSDFGYNGFTDNLTTLLPEDDAATANWGDGWRMPTVEEWQELFDNTTITETVQNDVNGLLFIASNGNSLFFSAAGFQYEDPWAIGIEGLYWSSSLGSDGPEYTWGLNFSPGYIGFEEHFVRIHGLPVRAVRSSRQN